MSPSTVIEALLRRGFASHAPVLLRRGNVTVSVLSITDANGDVLCLDSNGEPFTVQTVQDIAILAEEPVTC